MKPQSRSLRRTILAVLLLITYLFIFSYTLFSDYLGISNDLFFRSLYTFLLFVSSAGMISFYQEKYKILLFLTFGLTPFILCVSLLAAFGDHYLNFVKFLNGFQALFFHYQLFRNSFKKPQVT